MTTLPCASECVWVCVSACLTVLIFFIHTYLWFNCEEKFTHVYVRTPLCMNCYLCLCARESLYKCISCASVCVCVCVCVCMLTQVFYRYIRTCIFIPLLRWAWMENTTSLPYQGLLFLCYKICVVWLHIIIKHHSETLIMDCSQIDTLFTIQINWWCSVNRYGIALI